MHSGLKITDSVEERADAEIRLGGFKSQLYCFTDWVNWVSSLTFLALVFSPIKWG